MGEYKVPSESEEGEQEVERRDREGEELPVTLG